jgi:hypothetical protein
MIALQTNSICVNAPGAGGTRPAWRRPERARPRAPRLGDAARAHRVQPTLRTAH